MTAFLLLFGGIWGLVGSVVTVGLSASGGPLWNDLILDRRGVIAQATPTGVAPTKVRVDNRRVFRVSYSFIDDAGKPRSSAAGTTDPRLLAQLRIDGNQAPVTIEYDPRRPERSRVRGERASVIGLFVLLPLGFALIGSVIFGLGIRRAGRLRAIYVRGQVAAARVTRITPTSMRVNGQRVMRVDYVFDTILGQTLGRTTLRSPPALDSSIWVLYDEADPRRNVAA